MKPRVNVVIRTFNEEDWIKFCLRSVFSQTYENFKITVVDSGSTDGTLDIIRSFPQVSLVCIDDYKPGRAINIGAHSDSVTDYIVCLSAHCLPLNTNWLECYVAFMEANPNVAGAYGRQLPLSCTQADDARDLYLTFGEEQRINSRDYFFHNANSIIRHDVWERFQFDGDIKHIEDRAWAKRVLMEGFNTAYLPSAAVYHYHGLHQHGVLRSFRAVSVLSVIQDIEGLSDDNRVYRLLGNEVDVPVVVVVPRSICLNEQTREKVQSILTGLEHEELYFVCSSRFSEKFLGSSDVNVISRDQIQSDEEMSLRQLMRVVLNIIESRNGSTVDGLIFYDLGFKYLQLDMAQKCKELMFDEWLPSVLPAWKDFGNYWLQSENGFKNIYSSYGKREGKPALYRSVLGQGGALRASFIRSCAEEIPVGEVIWTEDATLLLRD